ncbi:MAG: hypothetical protein FJY92_08665 [Candidatus Hydrogenedentes bacterium]|nr:hypothetical protein [Candidatus Hydrogenedentota bacterium]
MVLRRLDGHRAGDRAAPAGRRRGGRTAVLIHIVLASCIAWTMTSNGAAEQHNLPEKGATESTAPRSFDEMPNVLPNGSFEKLDLETGRPRGWAVSPASILVKSMEEEADARDGRHSLHIQTTAETIGVVWAKLSPKLAYVGRSVSAHAWGQAPEAYSMYLTINCKVRGEDRELAADSWPECPDEWTPKKVRATIPADADVDSVRVIIRFKKIAGIACRLDAVRAVVEDDPPQPTKEEASLHGVTRLKTVLFPAPELAAWLEMASSRGRRPLLSALLTPRHAIGEFP